MKNIIDLIVQKHRRTGFELNALITFAVINNMTT